MRVLGGYIMTKKVFFTIDDARDAGIEKQSIENLQPKGITIIQGGALDPRHLDYMFDKNGTRQFFEVKKFKSGSSAARRFLKERRMKAAVEAVEVDINEFNSAFDEAMKNHV